MADKDSAVLRRCWRELYKPILKELFEVAERGRCLLTPDQALEEMESALKSALSRLDEGRSGEPRIREPSRAFSFRFDSTAFAREAHHYAVDLFYRTYYPRELGAQQKSRKGAPRLSIEYLDRILMLVNQGKRPFEIAHMLGQEPDAIRKQIATAKRRYRQIRERIYELGAIAPAKPSARSTRKDKDPDA